MIYKWRTGTQIKTKPEVAAKVMQSLANENNLNAAALVEVSRPVDAPLHSEFEWDDTQAAEKWRQHQGRNIINALVIVDETNKDSEPIRAYFKVETSEMNYEPLELILKDEDKIVKLQRQALSEFLSYRKKYSTIIEKINGEKEVESLQRKLESDERCAEVGVD